MKNQIKIKLIAELLPFLNELQNAENSKELQIVAAVKLPITYSDLMALSDEELEKLQKLMLNAKSAKKVQKSEKQYDENYKTSLEHNTKQYSIK